MLHAVTAAAKGLHIRANVSFKPMWKAPPAPVKDIEIRNLLWVRSDNVMADRRLRMRQLQLDPQYGIQNNSRHQFLRVRCPIAVPTADCTSTPAHLTVALEQLSLQSLLQEHCQFSCRSWLCKCFMICMLDCSSFNASFCLLLSALGASHFSQHWLHLCSHQPLPSASSSG